MSGSLCWVSISFKVVNLNNEIYIILFLHNITRNYFTMNHKCWVCSLLKKTKHVQKHYVNIFAYSTPFFSVNDRFPLQTPCLPPRSQHQLFPSYLTVQLPRSVVFLGTTSIKNGLIVHFYQLPLRSVTEVSKHTIEFMMI